MTPEWVGRRQDLAGHGQALRAATPSAPSSKELGYELGDNALEDAFDRFKELADRKKHVYDEDIEALVDEEIATRHDRIKVVALTVIAGTKGPQSATLTLDIDGEHQTVQATGNGPVDAIFNAIQALVPHKAKLALYQVHAVTEGTDAQAEVSVRLEEEGRTRDRPRRRSRHAGGLGEGLSRRAQQADGQAAEDGAGPAGDLDDRPNAGYSCSDRPMQATVSSCLHRMTISSSRPGAMRASGGYGDA